MISVTANEIWKGVVAVTGKAQTKARGKRPAKRIRKDLNKGQFIGDGKSLRIHQKNVSFLD